MTLSLTHEFVSSRPQSNNSSLVSKNEWNAEHVLTVNTQTILGRTASGTGPATDLTAAQALTIISPLTTRGDLMYRDGSATTRLPLGTSGYHLSSDGTDATWAGFLQVGEDAVTRSWLSKVQESFSAKDFGAVGDGSTDDTEALNTALASAGDLNCSLYIPSGIYLISASLFMPDNVRVYGDGPFQSIIKAADNSNMSTMLNASTEDYWEIVDLQFDGNAAENPTGGSAIFCSSSHHYLIERVRVKDCSGRGIDIAGPDTDEDFGMPAILSNVVVDRTGHHGIVFAGAHDAYFENVMVIDAGLETHNTYSGFVIEHNGRFVNCHAWSRGSTTNRMKYALDLISGACQFFGCHFEGASTANAHITGGQNIFEACMFYAAFDGGTNVLVRSQSNKISGFIDTNTPLAAEKGIVLGLSGDTVNLNYIDVIMSGQEAGMIDFTYSGGYNTIFVRGYNGSGSTNIIGQPASTDSYDIQIDGVGGETTILSNNGASAADSATNTISYPMVLRHQTSGTATSGFGIGQAWHLENAAGTMTVAGQTQVFWSDATNGSEDAGWSINLIRAGTLEEVLFLDHLGDLTVTNCIVADEAYGAGWDGSEEVPTKNAVYDKIELVLTTTLPGAYQPLDSDLTSWAGVTRASGFDTFVATPSLANLGSLLTDEATGLITFMTTPSSANLRALLTDETGTGVAYFAGGDAGTPSAIVLTNASGLTSAGVAAATLVTAADTIAANDNDTTWPTTAAIIDYAQPLDGDLTSWAGVTRASGFDTWAATPSLANFGSLLTDEGTGVITALGVNVGSAGAFVVNGGALGTPSSGTLTNCTGLPSIVAANEATDTTCFLAFFTAATGELGPKTNTNMTFNSSTGVATFASTVLTTTDINGGTVDGATIGGASAAAGTFTTLTVNTSILPGTDGAVDLGSTTAAFNNLHLDTGATINVENGNWVATHTSGILTVGTGDLRVTTAGTNTASVVTVGGSQTLTSKTLTSPTIGTSPTAAGATWTNLGTVTTADINGGTIDGTAIGGSSASTGAFTTLSATGNVTFDGGSFVFNEAGANLDWRMEGDTNVNLFFLDASADAIGVGTNAPDRRLHVEVDDATTNATTYPLRLTHTTSGTPAANIGVGMEFEVETSANNNEIGGYISAVAYDATAAAEHFKLQFGVMSGGAAASTVLEVSRDGLLLTPQNEAFFTMTAPSTDDFFMGVDTGAAEFGSNTTTTIDGYTNSINWLHASTAGAVHFPAVGTTGSAANAFLNNGASPANQLLRSTSSARYKADIEPMDPAIAANIVAELRPIYYRSLAEADEDKTFYGLTAEAVAAIDPRLVAWGYRDEDMEQYTDKRGRVHKRVKPGAVKVPDGVAYDRLVVPLLLEVQSLKARIVQLETGEK